MEDAAKEPTNKEKLSMLKKLAVQVATTEIIAENRAEIVKRARAKLVAMGVPFAEAETA